MDTDDYQTIGDPQTATLPQSVPFKTKLIIISISILLLATVLSVVLYTVVPQSPLPPSFTLTSLFAYSPSNITTETTWNLTLSVSNPNTKYEIFFDNIMLMLVFYSGQEQLPVDMGFAHVKDFIQSRKSSMPLSPDVSFYGQKFGKNDIFGNNYMVKNIPDDQKNGLLSINISAGVIMRYKKDEKERKMYDFFCKGLKVVFDRKPSIESTAFGFVPDLPMKCDLTSTGTLLSLS